METTEAIAYPKKKIKRKGNSRENGKNSVEKLLEKIEVHNPAVNVPNHRLKNSGKSGVQTSRNSGSPGRRGSKSDSSRASMGGISLTSRASVGSLSQRSYSIDMFGPNGELIQCERTMREMMYDIQSRTKLDLPPPVYVPSLDGLSAESFAWNSKVRRARSDSALPRVNFIGCHLPVELILAKADARSRKIKVTAEQKEKVCDEWREHVDALLLAKATRAEKYNAMMEFKQKQLTWIRIIKFAVYLKRVRHVFDLAMGVHLRERITDNFARMIQRYCKRWMFKRIVQKFKEQFLKKIRPHLTKIKLGIRIFRKRKAIQKIVGCLSTSKGQQKITIIIHHFLTSVRKIQKVAREFIACRHARVTALLKLWDKFEAKYIRKRMKERKEAKPMDKHKSMELNIDAKLRLEMEKQNSRWQRIDTLMEESIIKHKLSGNLRQDTGQDAVAKHFLPYAIKYKAMENMLVAKRREHLLKHRETHVLRAVNKTSFSPEDALELIRGKGNVGKIAQTETKVERVREPFLMFSWIKPKMIFQKIVQTHEAADTFAVNIGDNAESRAAKKLVRMRQMMQEHQHL